MRMRIRLLLALVATLGVATPALAMQQSLFADGERELLVDAEGELAYRTQIGGEVRILTESVPAWTGDAALIAYGREAGVLLFRLPARNCPAGAYMFVDFRRMLAERLKLADCNPVVDREVTVTDRALALRFVHQGGAQTALSIPPAARRENPAASEAALKTSSLLLREEANDLGAYTVQQLIELLSQCGRPAPVLTPAGRLGFTLSQDMRDGALSLALRPLSQPAGTAPATVLDLVHGLDRFGRAFTLTRAEEKLAFLSEQARCTP
jgi:hypothetical protein